MQACSVYSFRLLFFFISVSSSSSDFFHISYDTSFISENELLFALSPTIFPVIQVISISSNPFSFFQQCGVVAEFLQIPPVTSEEKQHSKTAKSHF